MNRCLDKLLIVWKERSLKAVISVITYRNALMLGSSVSFAAVANAFG